MSKFQIITIGVFILFIIAGVTSFALYKGNSQNTSIPPITVWGTFPANTFNQYVSTVNSSLTQGVIVYYVQKTPEAFSKDFVNALAIGKGPDAILISSDLILPQINKLTIIPYGTISERSFRDSYIQAANVYLRDDGILAIPFTVDPLVMYWNRDNYNAAGLATYPTYWDEFIGTSLKPGLVQKLTLKDSNSNIRKSAIAMGDFSNITNARGVLGSLMLQSGNPVTVKSGNGGIVSAIDSPTSPSVIPAISFFNQFSDPSDDNYSWNKGMGNDKTAFLAGKLSNYFGFASELSDIRLKGPNVNFDVAPLPQLRTGGAKSAYAKLFGFSFVRASANVNNAYQVISLLTSSLNLSNLSKTMYLPAVRNDVIAAGSNDPYVTIFNKTALISKTWLDVDPVSSRKIFADLIQSITSGKKSIDSGIKDASDQYDVILGQALQ